MREPVGGPTSPVSDWHGWPEPLHGAGVITIPIRHLPVVPAVDVGVYRLPRCDRPSTGETMRKRMLLGLGLALVGLALYRKSSSTPLTDRATEVVPTDDRPPEVVGGATTNDDPIDREDVPADVLEDEIGHGVDEASEALIDEDERDSAEPGDQTTGGGEDADETASVNENRAGDTGGSETGN